MGVAAGDVLRRETHGCSSASFLDGMLDDAGGAER